MNMNSDTSTDSLKNMSSPLDVSDCYNYIEARMETGDAETTVVPSDAENSNHLEQVLSQREQDLEVAARVGQALLRENQELREQARQQLEDSRKQIESLEQERHGLQVRLESAIAERDNAISELQNDIQAARCQLESASHHGEQTERGRVAQLKRATAENDRLNAQLQQAMGSEQKLIKEVERLRTEVAEKRSQLLQQHEQLQQLKLQAEETERERRRLQIELNAMKEQRDDLHDCVEISTERIHLLERQYSSVQEQLREQQDHVDALEYSRQELQEQLQRLVLSSGAALALHVSSQIPLSSQGQPDSLQPSSVDRLFSTDSLEPVHRLISNDSLEPSERVGSTTEDGGSHDDYHWDSTPVTLQLLPEESQRPVTLADELAQFSLSSNPDAEQPMFDSGSPEVDDVLPRVIEVTSTLTPSTSTQNTLTRRRNSLQEQSERPCQLDQTGAVSMYLPSTETDAELLAGHVQQSVEALQHWQQELKLLEEDVYCNRNERSSETAAGGSRTSGASHTTEVDWEEVDEGQELYTALHNLAEQAQTAVVQRMSLLEELQLWQAQTGERLTPTASSDEESL